MLFALITSIETDKKGDSKIRKNNNSKDKGSSGNKNEDIKSSSTPPLIDKEKYKRKDAKIPDWKKKAPGANEAKTKMKSATY